LVKRKLLRPSPIGDNEPKSFEKPPFRADSSFNILARVRKVIRPRLKAAYFGAFYPIYFCKATLANARSAGCSEHGLAPRSKGCERKASIHPFGHRKRQCLAVNSRFSAPKIRRQKRFALSNKEIVVSPKPRSAPILSDCKRQGDGEREFLV